MPPQGGQVCRALCQLRVQVEVLDRGEHLAELVLALLVGNLEEVGDRVSGRRNLDEDRGCLPDHHLAVLEAAPIPLDDVEDLLPDRGRDSCAVDPELLGPEGRGRRKELLELPEDFLRVL